MNQLFPRADSDIHEDLSNLHQYSSDFQNILSKYGISKKQPPTKDVIDFFCSQNSGERRRILTRIATYLNLIQNAAAEGHSVIGDKKLVWYAIKSLGLTPTSDLFERLKDDDVIEIYSRDGVQMFRNLQFCKDVTYSLEDVLVFQWTDLFKRVEHIEKRLYHLAFEVGFSGIRQAFPVDVPDHLTEEIKSEAKRKFQVSFSYLAPLLDKSNNAVAILAASKITPIF